MCDRFPQTTLETIAAVAGQGGLALEHAELLARLRGADEAPACAARRLSPYPVVRARGRGRARTS